MEPCSPRRTASPSTEGGELSAGVVRPHQPRVLAAPADIASHNYHCQKPDVHHVHPEASKGKTDEASRNMHDTTWVRIGERCWVSMILFSGPSCILIYVLISCSQDKLLCITSLLRSSCMWPHVCGSTSGIWLFCSLQLLSHESCLCKSDHCCLSLVDTEYALFLAVADRYVMHYCPC